MDYQKVALRVLWGSLCIAALAGVATLLVPSSSSIIGRLIGTAILTAIAAALLLISIRALQSQHYRPLGMTLCAYVCFIYVTSISGIWTSAISAMNAKDIPERFASSALLGLLFLIPLLAGAACFRSKRIRFAGKVFFWIWFSCFFIWLCEVWVMYWPYTELVEYFTGPLLSFSILFALSLLQPSVLHRIAGLGFASVACVTVQIGLLLSQGRGDLQNSPMLLLIALISGWSCAVLAVNTILTFRDKKHALVWGERITVFIVSIALAMFCVTIWYEVTRSFSYEFVDRVAGGTTILGSCAIIAVVVVQMTRASMFANYSGKSLDAICPRCVHKIQIKSGSNACPFCGLRMKLRIEPAGCRKCSYDLSGCTTSEQCPECGEPIMLPSTLE